MLLAVSAISAAVVVTVALGRDAREPTRDEYVAAINAICAEYGVRLDRIPPPGDLAEPGSVAQSLRRAIPVLEQQADAARGVPAPPALHQDVERFFVLLDRSLLELRRTLQAALERALYPMSTALTRFERFRDDAKALGRQIGFDC